MNVSDTINTLHSEILRFSNSTIKKVEEKSQFIFFMLEKISAIVSELLGGFIQLFGSHATGLAIQSSDIDLAVIGIEFSNRKALQDACVSLGKALESLTFVISCKTIITATIPVIKLQTDLKTYSGVSSLEMIDITFIDNVNCTHFGLEAVSFTRDLLILLPHIQYLAIVLKNFLYSINLNSAYHGNLYIRWVEFL